MLQDRRLVRTLSKTIITTESLPVLERLPEIFKLLELVTREEQIRLLKDSLQLLIKLGESGVLERIDEVLKLMSRVSNRLV